MLKWVLVLVWGLAALTQGTPSPAAPTATPQTPRTVFLIVMENHN